MRADVRDQISCLRVSRHDRRLEELSSDEDDLRAKETCFDCLVFGSALRWARDGHRRAAERHLVARGVGSGNEDG